MTTAIAPTVAGAFLDALAAQDFARIAATLDDDAHLTALVPSGFKQWHGTQQIGATFRRWFGDVDEFDLVDASVDEVGQRLHLCWRARVQAPARFGAGWFVVEQQVYADMGPDGRLAQLFLLCSGFCRESLS